MYSLLWGNHKSFLAEAIQYLLKRDVLVDCTLSAEGQHLKAHTIILAACSDYFESLFTQGYDKNPVALNDVKFQDLKTIVDFIYKGEVVVSSGKLCSFLHTAKSLQVKGLTSLLKQYEKDKSTCDLNPDWKCTECDDKRKLCNSNFSEKVHEKNGDVCFGRVFSPLWQKPEGNEDSKDESRAREGNEEVIVRQIVSPASSHPVANKCVSTLESQDRIEVAVTFQPHIKQEGVASKENEGGSEMCDNVSNLDSVDQGDRDGEVVIKKEIEVEKEVVQLLGNSEVPKQNLTALQPHQMGQFVNVQVMEANENGIVVSSNDPKQDGTPVDLSCTRQPRRGTTVVDVYSSPLESSVPLKSFDSNNAQCVVKEEKSFFPKISEELCNYYDSNKMLDDESQPTNHKRSRQDKTFNCQHCGVEFSEKRLFYNHKRCHAGQMPFQCQHCDKKFAKKSKLIAHLRIHTGEKPYKCQQCGKQFALTGTLTKHLLIHTGEKPFQCQQCDKKFTQKCHLTAHQGIHISSTPFMCQHCGKQFSSKGTLIKHLRLHSGEKPYKCQHCTKLFSSKDSLTNHLRIHSGEKPFQCQHCGKQFSVENTLRKHLRLHTGERPFQCQQCNRKFTQKIHLTTHLRIHTAEKPYKCQQCGKLFSMKSTLTRHIRIHTAEKPYECQHCTKTFTQKSHLISHEGIHATDKPFKCQHCDKQFSVNGSLIAHLKIHTGEKPFKCQYCGKLFPIKGTLTRHLRIHTGEKPFQCQHCGKQFTIKGNLNKHLIYHSGEKPHKCEYCGKVFPIKGTLQRHMRIHSEEKPYKCQQCDKFFSDNGKLSKHLRIHNS